MANVTWESNKIRIREYLEFSEKVNNVLRKVLDGGSLEKLCEEEDLPPRKLRWILNYFDKCQGKTDVPVDFVRNFSGVRTCSEYIYSEIFGNLSLCEEMNEKLDNDELNETIELALSVLPLRDKEILLLRANGASFKSIGEKYKVSKQAIHCNVYRSLKTLRQSDFAKMILKKGKPAWDAHLKVPAPEDEFEDFDLKKTKQEFFEKYPAIANSVVSTVRPFNKSHLAVKSLTDKRIIRVGDFIGHSIGEITSLKGFGKKRFKIFTDNLSDVKLKIDENGTIVPE